MARVNVFGMSEKAEATAAQETENYVEPSEVMLARRCSLMAGWLYFVTLMVVIMVVIGGLTRLTNSGLSMVEWRPLTGWLPPFQVMIGCLSLKSTRHRLSTKKSMPACPYLNSRKSLAGVYSSTLGPHNWSCVCDPLHLFCCLWMG